MRTTIAQLQAALRDVQAKQGEVKDFFNTHLKKFEEDLQEMKASGENSLGELQKTMTTQLAAQVQDARSEIEGAIASQTHTITDYTSQLQGLEAYVMNQGTSGHDAAWSPGSED